MSPRSAAAFPVERRLANSLQRMQIRISLPKKPADLKKDRQLAANQDLIFSIKIQILSS
jgi:hypothetical protein